MHPVNALCMPAEGSPPSPWLATFSAGFPINFLEKPAEKISNDDYMITRCFAITTQCKWVAKHPRCDHVRVE